jgi:CTP-dependent riboflavin kinase
MKDRILEIYEIIKKRPHTVKEVEEKTDTSESYAWTKLHALDRLGKIKLKETSEGYWIAYYKRSKSFESAKKQALENWRDLKHDLPY